MRGGKCYSQRSSFKEYIKIRDNYTCRKCGCKLGEVCSLHHAPVRQLDVAHIIPWPEGPSTEENMHLLCHPCNKLDHPRSFIPKMKPIDDWFAHIQELRDSLP